MDIDKTLAERGTRYGDPQTHALTAQDLQRAMTTAPGWVRLADDQRRALQVIADNIARILNGDPNYADYWYDIIGCTTLVERRLADDSKKITP